MMSYELNSEDKMQKGMKKSAKKVAGYGGEKNWAKAANQAFYGKNYDF